MEPIERSFLEWAQIRSGQVLLFWGTLELILEAFDVLAKWDLLLTVRGSLPAELEFLADPRVALLLLALAFVLIWDGNRLKERARSVLDQIDEPKRKNPSAIEATAIPFFLAFVCAISFTALEWNSPRREALAQTATSPSSRDLAATLERRLELATRAPRSSVAEATAEKTGKPAGRKGANAVEHSSPIVTPQSLELDTDAANDAAVAGNPGEFVSPPALNRLVPSVTYAYNGERKVSDSGQATPEVDTQEHKLFDQIRRAHQDKNWPLLASLSETAIQQTPEWLTPYLFAGEAYANLGRIDRAIDRLEYVRKKGAGIPDDRFAVQQASKLRESIRVQYGR